VNQPDLAHDPAEAWFNTLVAEYSEPERLAESLVAVKLAAAYRRVARRMVLAPAGGLLVKHAMAEIGRYFRREPRGEVDLHEVCKTTGIPLTDARAVLREFVAAGMLAERVKPAANTNEPPQRLYQLTESGSLLAAEVVIQADDWKTQACPQRIPKFGWEGA
jgi:hypothetical protein